jgi:hypothetical protein
VRSSIKGGKMTETLVLAALLIVWVVFTGLYGLYIYYYYQGRKDLKLTIKYFEELIKGEK